MFPTRDTALQPAGDIGICASALVVVGFEPVAAVRLAGCSCVFCLISLAWLPFVYIAWRCARWLETLLSVLREF